MAQKKRDTMRYELLDGKKVVYRGITNDLERRIQEHKNQGKNFTDVNKVGRAVTKESARKWEKDAITSYKNSHGGKNTKYNKNT